jgi:hypothetical protein
MKLDSRLLMACLLAPLPLAAAMADEPANDPADDEPLKCISITRINRTEIIDTQTIAFHMRNGDIYVNRLDRACRGLTPGKPFSYSTPTGQICSVDTITILENFGAGLSRGAFCALGEFAPADEEMLEFLKEDKHENIEVKSGPVEVEE